MAAALESHVGPGLDDATLADDVLDVYDDILRMTPADTPLPGEEAEIPYRCPVSTPANFVHSHGPKVRRTKPMPVSLEICLSSRSTTKRSAGGRPPRPGGATQRGTGSQQQVSMGGGGGGGGGGGRLGVPGGGQNAGGCSRPTPGLLTPRAGGFGPPGKVNARSLDYYYVDKGEENREAAETNTFWLKALCSQPVTEILDKYRRRSDFRRNRVIWTKTYATPGERSLLKAWETNNNNSNTASRGSRLVGGGGPASSRGRLAASVGDGQSLRLPRSGKTGGQELPVGGGSKGGSGGSPKSYRSEPVYPVSDNHRSRGYTTDEEEGGDGDDDFDDNDNDNDSEEGEADDDDDDDDATTYPGGGRSVMSGDVSVSTPTYSRRQMYSPAPPRRRVRGGGGGSQRGRQGGYPPESESSTSPAPSDARSSVLFPTQPTCDISDHFQVTLPFVKDQQPNHNRLGTPKSRGALKPFTYVARRRAVQDPRLLMEAPPVPEVLESPRESLASRSTTTHHAPRNTPRNTPRSGVPGAPDTLLPAIGRV